MVNGRIGSLFVEWLLKIIHLVTFRDYKLFLEAEQKDEDKKLIQLIEINNMYRSMISVAFTAIVVKLYHVWIDLNWCFGNITEWVILVVILLLFTLAYRKQTKFIVSRIDYLTNK